MAKICLHGDLQRFGRRFTLSVQSASEAIRALSVQLPGFRRAVADGYFRVRIRKQDVTRDSVTTDLHRRLGDRDVIHLVPVVAGAKNGGLIGVIAGAVLIVAGVWTGNAYLVNAGIGLLAGGAAMLLAGTPTQEAARDADNGPDNTSFSNLDNSIAQGSAVQVTYGEVMVGSKVLSQGLETY